MSLYKELSEERKKLQTEGLIPEFYSTPSWQLFKEKYLYNANNVKEQFQRIAKVAASYVKHIPEYKNAYNEFYNLLWKGWLSPSTPVLSNLGTDRGLSVSCSGGFIDDSINGFYTSRKETALLTKYGFGTSSYLGGIRPRGSHISNGGKASGIVPVFKGFVQDSKDVSQGNTRRGSWAGYVEITHEDWDELADYVLNDPDNSNVGWIITDEFIDGLNKGNKDYIRRYQKALKLKMVTGRGYFCFIDKINRNRPEMYKKNNLDVKASNLCLTGDQRVVTSLGYLTAKELYEYNFDLELFDGKNRVNSSKMLLREKNADIYQITYSNGMKQKVTDNHGIPVIIMKPNGENIIKRVECKDLCIDDEVAIQINKGLFGIRDMQDEAFLLGLYQSDGTQYKNRIFIDVWENDFNLIEEVELKIENLYNKYNLNFQYKEFKNNHTPFESTDDTINQLNIKKKKSYSFHLFNLDFNKGCIPQWIWESNEKTQWEYLRGLFYRDWISNIIVSEFKNDELYPSITSVNREFLEELQLLMSNLGLQFSINESREDGCKLLPNEKGEYELYHLKDIYALKCDNKISVIEFEKHIKFISQNNKDIEIKDYRDNQKKSTKVVSIEYLGKEDVYCPTIYNKEHIFISQGLKTYNCDEISLFSDKDHTFSCVLSSMNIAKYDEWKDTNAVFWSTIFLDCIAEDLIQKGKNLDGLENVVRFTEKGRALGLGQCGFHSYLQSHMIPFESLSAQFLNREISKHIFDESLRASKHMAEKLGEPEWCKGFGVRNTHRCAIAPTKSSALLMGGISEGINPDPAMIFTQTSAGGEIERINPILLSIMKERGVFNKKVVSEIKDNKGSVQNVDWLSNEEKSVFKTAFEINQEIVIRLASQRAEYIDQWQSLNLFFSADEDEEWISNIHKLAFQDEKILGLYYIYSQAGVNASRDCESCS